MSVVIQVNRLSKQYRLGTIGGKRLVDDVNRWWADFRGKEDPLSKVGVSRAASRKQKAERASGAIHSSETIWALKDVSFEVKQGEVLGIIGRNGAGKSTLLKILSRVTGPTSGEVRVKGRIASLLEVGTGFHPELTGRENVFLNGAILGMTKAEIRAKFDEIVDFSGVEQFIDTPVKRYSSGMTVRVAFAVAAHLEPEILVIDEVLAVGDADFQKKCLGKMRDVAGEGRTVLFVTHNMNAIRTLCSDGVVLERGKVSHVGKASASVQFYESKSSAGASNCWVRPLGMPRKALSFEKLSCHLAGQQPNLNLVVDVLVRSNAFHRLAFLAIDILDSSGTALMQALPSADGFIRSGIMSQEFRVTVHLPPIIPGRYSLTIWAGPHYTETLEQVNGVVDFDVNGSPAPTRSFPYPTGHGFMVPASQLAIVNASD
jgi:lipopolysaccharide transport system ATP-binding protein